jgi:ubiquinone/menaquinone biosynthesis C-methylase UbiE
VTEAESDIWSQWILHKRHGDDPERLRSVLQELIPVRDRVLANAKLAAGELLLDVGCGDGLIAFGALQLAEGCQVVFSDVSEDILAHVRSIAQEMGFLDRSRFLNASADDLSDLESVSVDVVTTRSVLIYVSDKQRAFNEFYRVLRPTGRLSIFEPINSYPFPDVANTFCGYDVAPVEEIASKVRAIYQAIQPPETDPMLNFDERDLLAYAWQAGFSSVELHLEVVAAPMPTGELANWEAFLRSSGNPKIPTVGDAIERALTPEERTRFVAHLQPLVESRRGSRQSAVAYLWAKK